MISQYLSLATALLPAALAARYQLYDEVPTGWTAKSVSTSSASSTTQVFTIALVMQNIDQLESKLVAVSTPGNAEYGQFLDAAETNATFAPSDDAVSSVTAWLKSGGVSDYYVDGAFVDFAASIDTVNTLLNASYTHYTSPAGVTKLRTLSYALPDTVDEHIALVDPGVYFGGTKAMLPRPPSKTAPTNIDSRGVTRGAYRGLGEVYDCTIPSGTLVAGTNTVTITVISGSSGDVYLSPNVVSPPLWPVLFFFLFFCLFVFLNCDWND
jgi:subtilase family serine protease